MTLRILYTIILFLLISIFSLVIATHIDNYVSNPLLVLLGFIVIASIAWCFVKLLPTHWLIRSAEWQLMELVHRVETGTDSRTRKGDEKLALFTQLARETQQVYVGPAQAGGHQRVGDLPKAPFRHENLMLLNSQDSEMDKVSKRKGIVRLNAALLREILYGTRDGYKSRIAKLSQTERETVMANIEALAKIDSTVVWYAAKLFRHPGKTICWAPKSLTGRQALDFLTRV
jgi:hypothetical protein